MSEFSFQPALRSCSSNSVASEGACDGLYNYDVLEEIGRGVTSTVYLATCKRGRLRNRCVALKKVLLSSPETTGGSAKLPSTSLHQALHHPSIVSLLSAFSTPTAQYHVLELCPCGTLSSFLRSRDPPILSENELRGVIRSLVDALVYLRKELILHRDINPCNVLLNEHCRVKLSDFELATRLPSETAMASILCGSPNYMSPEMIARSPYNFSTDIWSLGCLIVTCLSGFPPFEAPSVAQIHSKISRAAYNLPETVSYEAKDLVSGLLQLNPDHRVPLHRILSHPFFNPSLPVKPLHPSANLLHTQNTESPVRHRQLPPSRSEPDLDSHQGKPSRYPPTLSKIPSTLMRHHTSQLGPNFNSRKPLGNIGNLGSYYAPDDVKCAGNFPFALTTRRVSSAPQSYRPPTLTSDEQHQEPRAPRSKSVASLAPLAAGAACLPSERNASDCPHVIKPSSDNLIDHPLLLRPLKRQDKVNPGLKLATHSSHGLRHRSVSQESGKAPQTQNLNFASAENGPSAPPPRRIVSHSPQSGRRRRRSLSPISRVPIGMTKPMPLNTLYLSPQTHKTAKGQVTVLPSLSLLIDFREGERRKGRKGNEIMVVSPDGMNVNVYSAPHLSTPCCLVEPIAVYSLEDLPVPYWKQYIDASRVVDHLLQRIPKLVLYKPEAKCTLMANEPEGDIEVLLPPSDSWHRADKLSAKPTTMRIRLLRRTRTVEIARYVSHNTQAGSGAGEWTKKIMALTGPDIGLGKDDQRSLDAAERMGLTLVANFLRVCEALKQTGCGESMPEEGGPGRCASPPYMEADVMRVEQHSSQRQQLAALLQSHQVDSAQASSDTVARTASTRTFPGLNTTAATTDSTVFPSIHLAPRPAKFSRSKEDRDDANPPEVWTHPVPQGRSVRARTGGFGRYLDGDTLDTDIDGNMMDPLGRGVATIPGWG